ncbi:substrate-binding domain-containing protein [Lentzea sp. DG1S-22]|uniref:substrate-binding domain-containing protein n=1 Tax=Lentzea sp. DG1S-22 TaxID=3108822 RepID=UPI003FA58431
MIPPPPVVNSSMLVVVLLLAACGTPATGQEPKPPESALVGVTMPTTTSQRWLSDGENIKRDLESRGYRVDLQYAQNDVPSQAKQVESQIAAGAKLLIIASVDGSALTAQLRMAAEAGIPVIAYDQLLRGSPDGAAGPFNVELFAGSADDNNAAFFFNGAMSVLKPYIEDGKLVVRSGQTDYQAVTTLRWDGETARKRMEEIVTASYRRAKVDGVLSPYDGISLGILAALKNKGYGPASRS